METVREYYIENMKMSMLYIHRPNNIFLFAVKPFVDNYNESTGLNKNVGKVIQNTEIRREIISKNGCKINKHWYSQNIIEFIRDTLHTGYYVCLDLLIFILSKIDFNYAVNVKINIQPYGDFSNTPGISYNPKGLCYFLIHPKTLQVKIGKSIREIYSRLKEYPEDYIYVKSINVTDCHLCEKELLEYFCKNYQCCKGKEYFIGDVPKMYKNFNEICEKYIDK